MKKIGLCTGKGEGHIPQTVPWISTYQESTHLTLGTNKRMEAEALYFKQGKQGMHTHVSFLVSGAFSTNMTWVAVKYRVPRAAFLEDIRSSKRTFST